MATGIHGERPLWRAGRGDAGWFQEAWFGVLPSKIVTAFPATSAVVCLFKELAVATLGCLPAAVPFAVLMFGHYLLAIRLLVPALACFVHCARSTSGGVTGEASVVSSSDARSVEKSGATHRFRSA
ncbi:MAG: hypothetical protein ACQESR_20820 [Planctomycetota bacterium]